MNRTQIDFPSNVSLSSEFEGMSRIYHHVEFKGKLGMGSYISKYSDLHADIGRFTSIAPYVRSNSGKHPFKAPYVSTSPCFYSLKKQAGGTFATQPCFDEFSLVDRERDIAVRIGSDCWIGEGAFLVGGTVIHTGAVVLAHAVVTHDVPPYAIVAGVPARIVGYRYDEETVQFLLKTRWWEQNAQWFRKHGSLLTDLHKFKAYFSKIESSR